MNRSKLLVPLEACDNLQAIAFLLLNRTHLSKLKEAGITDRSVCRWIVEFCNKIAHLKHTSVIVETLLDEILDSKFASHLLQQLQDLARLPETAEPDQSLVPFLISLSSLTGLLSQQDPRKGIANSTRFPHLFKETDSNIARVVSSS